MNRKEINGIFAEMEPTSSQKQKMLEGIINTTIILPQKPSGASKILKIAASLVLVLFLTGTTAYATGVIDNTSIVALINNYPTSSQSDYPSLPPCSIAISVPSSLSDQVKNSALIVDATVVSVLPDEKRTYNPESGSAEAEIYDKMGTIEDTVSVRPVIFSINESIVGSAKSQITMYISPIALDCSPKFAKGDRMILMLCEDEDGSYYSTTFQESYYYISKDKRIYPAFLTEENKIYSGRSLSRFKKEIKRMH